MSMNQSPDRALIDAVFDGDVSLALAHLHAPTDVVHLLCRELRFCIALALVVWTAALGSAALGDAVPDVVEWGAREEVCRVAAGRIVAQVAHDDVIGDSTVGELVSEPVSAVCLGSLSYRVPCGKAPVSSGGQNATPRPAFRLATANDPGEKEMETA